MLIKQRNNSNSASFNSHQSDHLCVCWNKKALSSVFPKHLYVKLLNPSQTQCYQRT